MGVERSSQSLHSTPVASIVVHRFPDRRVGTVVAEPLEEPVALQPVLHRVLHLGEAQSTPLDGKFPFELPEDVGGGRSRSVTGSAATTTHRTGVGDEVVTFSARQNSSALAKKSGASQRKSTRPGTRWRGG